MQNGVTERTILAPLALILVAAILTVPLALLLASREVDQMADARLGAMVGEMFSSHLDDVTDDLARELLAKADAHGGAVQPEIPPSFATLARRLADAPAIDAYQGELQWYGGAPVVAVVVRHPASGKILIGAAPLDRESLKASFADRLGLDDFRLERIRRRDDGRTHAEVVWQDRRDGATISWVKEHAGKSLLRRLAPLIGGLVVVITLGGALLIGRARRLAHRVVDARAQAEHLALHDPLTGLANRALFLQNLNLALARNGRGLGAVGVFMVDLDRFKAVNDTLGHQAGDDLIVETSRRLSANCRASDTVARFGGDEFAILASAPSEAGLHQLAERLVGALQDEVQVRGGTARLSGSVGLASLGETPLAADELLRRADLALYQAKHSGRARHSAYATQKSEA
ncbi:hypothetical protein SGCZBJ_20415 [Caulobacter zeae]|uniref:GGDEF domain-containing protein n=1 Tax=Caulobacter zeae TaxID=2055137 RepID=A0A2N5D7A1_9CAUL|nr:GGDEF domain-containing protein [Caulobacter zeae]PLR21931.1 hypothetical protein SGCZBJ_20415 [Caulobacter zeae]